MSAAAAPGTERMLVGSGAPASGAPPFHTYAAPVCATPPMVARDDTATMSSFPSPVTSQAWSALPYADPS